MTQKKAEWEEGFSITCEMTTSCCWLSTGASQQIAEEGGWIYDGLIWRRWRPGGICGGKAGKKLGVGAWQNHPGVMKR